MADSPSALQSSFSTETELSATTGVNFTSSVEEIPSDSTTKLEEEEPFTHGTEEKKHSCIDAIMQNQPP